MSKVIIETEDGKEKELETVPSYEEKPADVHEGSGFYSTLQDFLGDEDDPDKKNGKDKSKTDDDDKDAETKGKKAEDIKDLLDGADDKSKDEDKGGNGESDDDTSGGDKDKDKGGDNESSEFDELEPEALKTKAIEIKTSLTKELSTSKEKVVELEDSLKTVQEQLGTLQKDGVGDPEVTEFFKGLRKDFAGTVQKYREKYNIPANQEILTQLGGGASASKNARLKQFIASDLKPQIETDFKLEKGTFKFDKDAAWDDPESASYAFRKGLEAKEDEFTNADVRLKLKEKETIDLIQTRQSEDKKWFAEKYHGDDLTKVEGIVASLNAIPAKIAKGEMKPEDHPLSLRYILRGYHYDDLVKGEVNTAVDKLKTQLKDLGVTFPDGKELPTDLTTIKKKKPAEENKPIKIEQSKYSPMALSIEDTLNN